MIKNKLETRFKNIASILLICAVLIVPMNIGGLHSFAGTANAEANASGLICIEDDFNRADGDIHDIDNGGYWYSQCTADSVSHQIVDGVLNVEDYSRGSGITTAHSRFTDAQNGIYQRVSADIVNLSTLTQYSSASMHLRYVHPSNYSTGPDYGYCAIATNRYIRIIRINHSWSPTTSALDEGGEETYYAINDKHQYRFEFTAEGVNPTKLTATLYDMTAGGIAVVTLSGSDSYSKLQGMGTVALSATANKAGSTTAQFDNFKYEYSSEATINPTETVVFSDDFNRDNGEIGNGWVASQGTYTNIIKDSINANKIISNSVILEPSYNNNLSLVPESAWVRPMSEATLNQSVSADFQPVSVSDSTITSTARINSGGVVVARCQGETANASNCYYLVARLAFNSVGAWQTNFYLYNSESATAIATKTVYIDPKTRHRLELSVTSISDTKSNIIAYFHNVDTDGNITKTTTICDITDDDPNLQKAGTVGFSAYAQHSTVLSVDNFRYTTPYEPEAPALYNRFEAEAYENRANNYGKLVGGVSNASDLGAAMDNKTSVPIAFNDITTKLNSDSGYVIFAVYAEKAGEYPVKLRYKFGCDSQADIDTYAAVVVNGKDAYKFVNGAANGEFGTTDDVIVALNEGVNLIYCMAPTAEVADSLSGAYIDYDCLFILGDVKSAVGNISIPGDANCDNIVDVRDMVRMKKYTEGNSVVIDNVASDLILDDNGITARDLSKLRTYILGISEDSNEFDTLTWPKFNTTEYPNVEDMLNNTYYKLKIEKELTVGYLGGSITDGYALENPTTQSWSALTSSWLQEQYPEANITSIDGAVGGKGTAYGLANIVELLNLSNDTPDLVFIEYAVNDFYNGETSSSAKNNMESIIRTIYSYAPDADIMIVLTGELTNMNLDYKTKVAHQWVAESFKLPYISVASLLFDEMVFTAKAPRPSENSIWNTYFNDFVHPNATGAKKYAEYVTDYIAEIFKAKNAIPEESTNSYVPLKELGIVS